MAKLDKTIAKLTEEQLRTIEFLRGHSRVCIQGCAGSGKTLVAMEKAIRLDRAGLRVLVLCHNHNLASMLRTLSSGTCVEVFDFRSWLRTLGACLWMNADWHVYEEPTDDDLAIAFEKLNSIHSRRYDAVIVDEGQDFRESWWTLIDAALRAPQIGMLYVFFDNNQSLLPHRGLPPIVHSPYVLSRNCRNAGAVFEIVRRLCPAAPDPTKQLENLGIVKLWPYREFDQSKKEIALAVSEAMNVIPSRRIVVITTEPDPAQRSILHGMQFEHDAPWRWQVSVTKYVTLVSNTFGRHGHFIRPKLSLGAVPTEADVVAVRESMKSAILDPRLAASARFGATKLNWSMKGGSLYINIVKKGRTSIAAIWAFLQDPEWANSIRKLRSVRVLAATPGTTPENSEVPLYTVTSFKGLEADGVVLLIGPHRANFPKIDGSWCSVGTYVGISRARFLLYVVAGADSREASLITRIQG